MNRPRVAVVLPQEEHLVNLKEWVEAGQAIAYLESHGIPARGYLVRTPRQRTEALSEIAAITPDVVFILVGCWQLTAARTFLENAIGLASQTALVAGGPFATLHCQELLDDRRMTGIILGEWIEALEQFARRWIETGKGDNILGMLYRTDEGWSLSGQRTYDPELDAWPDPSYTSLRLTDMVRYLGGAVPIHASRGFPFQSQFSVEPLIRHLVQSDFCYYMRPPDRVLAEAARLARDANAQSFIFVDELFPWTDKWLEKFVEGWRRDIRLPFRIRWASEYVTEERLHMLRSASLERIEICVDGANEQIRRSVSDLNQTNERIREAVATLHVLQIDSVMRLMVGLPRETSQTLNEAVDMAKWVRASHTIPERYREWPDSPSWRDTERALTEGIIAPRPRPMDMTRLEREIALTIAEIRAIDSQARSRSRPRQTTALLDGISDFRKGTVQSPHEFSSRIDHFSAPAGSHDVIALRVPAEITWEITIPESPTTLFFGVLLRPELAGERIRRPVFFSVRLAQEGDSVRLFHKVLVQALDPDSRRWHWFRLPVTHARPGSALITLENGFLGRESGEPEPEREVWAGWAGVLVSTQEQADPDDPNAAHTSDDSN